MVRASLLQLLLLHALQSSDAFVSPGSVIRMQNQGFSAPHSAASATRQRECRLAMAGDAEGSYYGEANGSFMITEFSKIGELEEIVKLASLPIPERPDGIVCVAKYSSATRQECRDTEAEYERIARSNPATVFLRCMEEYPDAAMLIQGEANVSNFPTFDIFYAGNRVARVETSHAELEDLLNNYQFQNSKLDLFSENAENARKLRWGDGRVKDMSATPRTTARFVPGYDWDTDRGFFDTQADKAQESFEKMFERFEVEIDEDDMGNSNKK